MSGSNSPNDIADESTPDATTDVGGIPLPTEVQPDPADKAGVAGAGDAGTPTPATARRSIFRSGLERERRELERALDSYAARGDLGDEEREILATMADRITSGILAGPAGTLADAAADGDHTPEDEAVRTAIELFGKD